MTTLADRRHQQREISIKEKESNSGMDVHSSPCLHLNAHIHAMLDEGGEHLHDIPDYLKLMNDTKDCKVSTVLQNRLDTAKNRGIIIGGRRASKHSKKHKKSKKSRKSRKSKKTKSRRH